MKILKTAELEINRYEYIGNCITTEGEYWDATEMAQLIENSEEVDIWSVHSLLQDYLKEAIDSGSEFSAGEYQNIMWVLDEDADIHYFYKKL